MDCFVYRSEKQSGMYLYLSEKDDFSCIPESLIDLLGVTRFSFEFDLSEDRKLLKAEANEVMRVMKENGYFLQMPPSKNELFGVKAN